MIRPIASVLLVAACVCCAGPSSARTDPQPRDIRAFRPSTNGFAFVNHFSGSPIPFSLGGLENRIGAPTEFGLCGGMSFAAADLYLSGKQPPARDQTPSKGEPEGGGDWFDYIQKRQLASLGPGLREAVRFGRWMSLPDNGGAFGWPALGTRTMTLAELDRVESALESGRPAVLGLVFNRHANNADGLGRVGVPWENHQVLAYEIAAKTENSGVSVRVYDPNYPKRDDVAVRFRPVITGTMLIGPWGDVRVPVLGVEAARVVGKDRPRPMRGVFMMPYEQARVPETLH